MTQSDLMKLAMAGGLLFAGYKFGGPEVRTASVALAAVIVGQRAPVLKDVL